MPTNDYDVIVFKLLVYYYACLKRTTVFKHSEFDLITKKADVKGAFSKGLKENRRKPLSGNIRNNGHTRVEVLCVVVFLYSSIKTVCEIF